MAGWLWWLSYGIVVGWFLLLGAVLILGLLSVMDPLPRRPRRRRWYRSY